jgi:hypothetical protein
LRNAVTKLAEAARFALFSALKSGKGGFDEICAAVEATNSNINAVDVGCVFAEPVRDASAMQRAAESYWEQRALLETALNDVLALAASSLVVGPAVAIDDMGDGVGALGPFTAGGIAAAHSATVRVREAAVARFDGVCTSLAAADAADSAVAVG